MKRINYVELLQKPKATKWMMLLLFAIALPCEARDLEKQQFLNALFNGREYPVALTLSEAYPWRADGNTVKTTSRQDDVMSNCWFSLDVYVPEDSASVSFGYRVRYHKETYGWAKYATLTCTVDGEEAFSNNGNDAVETATIKIGKGFHQLKWNLRLGEAWENWDYFASISNMRFEGISDDYPLPEFNKGSVPFYNIDLNKQKQDTLVVENMGKSPLNVEKILGIDTPFRILNGENQTIPSGGIGEIIISFEPEYEEYYETEMTIVTNAGNRIFPVNGISSSGYVVVSPTPGKLSSILTNTNCESVSIMGHLNRADQYHLYKLQKCRFLNLAGTDIEVIANGGLNGLWKLQTLILPKSLKILDTTWTNQATFEGNTKITYFDLTSIQCLSPIPPKVYNFYGEGGSSEEQQLGNLRSSTNLLVPESSLSEYASNPIWNKLTIVPVNNELVTLKVQLDTPNNKDYSGMTLILNNKNTKESTSFTLDTSLEYSFVGLHSYYQYEVLLKDKLGRILGQIEDMELQSPSTTIVMTGIKDVHSVNCIVIDETSSDVTSQISFEWTDESGNQLSDKPTVDSALEGDSLICMLVLPESLGRIYVNPKSISVKVSDKDTSFVCQLTHIPELVVQGVIKDAVYKKPIENASIFVSQYMNGQYQISSKAVTDGDGQYYLNLKNDSTVLSVMMQDYETCKLGFANLEELEELSEICIQPIQGVPVNIQFSYQASIEEGVEPNMQKWYDDYSNVNFIVHNNTTNTSIEKIEYKWPTLNILENCAVGDSISIIVESKTNSFYPVESMCIIDSLGKGTASIPIVELGIVKASFNHSDNQATVGLLFGTDMKLVKSLSYHSSKVSFDNLKDGRYSLVTMGANSYYNTIPSLLSLRDYHLVEGEDYVMAEFDVSRGIITTIQFDSIPSFNADAHRFTGSGTYFSINKSSVVAGNYVTVDTKVDFISSLKDKIQDVSLVVELPSDVSFVKNSLLIGGNTSTNYSINGNTLTIPLKNFNEKVRFCLQPSVYGNYITGGSAKFSVDDNEFTQPIGSASFSVSGITLSLTSVTPYKEISVSGQTLANADITIYDNNIPVGKTVASGSGKWQTKIPLDNPYNLSHHKVYAKIETSDGIEMQSEVKDVLYDKNQIAVSKVTMYHDNPEVGKTYAVVFDFINPSPVTSSYTYYIYNKNFTFTIDLTENDSERVKDVVLWVETGKGNEVALDAKYDEDLGLWVASGQFGNMYDGDIPVNVSVSLRQNPVVEIDDDLLKLQWDKHLTNIKSFENIKTAFRSVGSIIELEFEKENISRDVINEQIDLLLSYLDGFYEDEDYDAGDDMLSLDEALDSLHDILNTAIEGLPFIPQEEYGIWSSSINGYSFTTIISKPEKTYSQYLSEDFEEFKTTSSNPILVKQTETGFIWVDLTRNFEEIYAVNKSSSQKNSQRIVGPVIDNEFWTDFRGNLLDNMIPDVIDIMEEAVIFRARHQIASRIGQAKRYGRLIKQLPISAKEDIQRYKKWIDECLTIALDKQNWINLVENFAAIGRLLVADLGHLKEEINMLDVIDNKMPPIYECAWMKYPDEIRSMMLEILNYRQQIGWDTGARIGMEVGEVLSNCMVAGAGLDALQNATSRNNWNTINTYIDTIEHYNSTCIKEERQRLIDEGWFESNCPDAPNQIDPSGFVYETVPSNRLQGVKATVYQKIETENMYGDVIEKAVVWDARNFEQENPLYTDENGLYRWDVPEGLWQVKFEKDGYETTYTDWLPVPPPQLDINVPMKQFSQPTVVKAEWTERGVEIQFNKYMLPSTINERTISVLFDGHDILDTIEFVDKECSDVTNDSFVSKLKVSLTEQFDEKDVIDVIIKGNVKSYAGIHMGSDKSYRLSQVSSVTEYVVPDSLSLKTKEYVPVHIQVKSIDAAAGKRLSIFNSAPLICSTDNEVILDHNGETDINIYGNLPGATTLILSIDGYNLVKQVPVIVTSIDETVVKTPYASIEDNANVSKGTEVYLHCDTKGATIYYTIDGSCPCNYETRIRYNGNPIVIEEDTELKMMASKPGHEDSDVATYHYHVLQSSGIQKQKEQSLITPRITDDYVYLNFSGNAAVRVTVYNMNGEIIQTKSNVPDGSRINLSNIPSGIYVVSILLGGTEYSEKVVRR